MAAAVVAFDTETDGLEEGTHVNVASLHDTRVPGGVATSFVRRADDAAAHLIRAVAACQQCNVLATFNGTAFDFRIMAARLDNLADKRHCAELALSSYDLMLDFAASSGYMSSLDSFCGASLNAKKSSTGAAAVLLWAAGDTAAVQAYCEKDAALTAQLFEYGGKWGRLHRTTRAGKQRTWALEGGAFRVAKDALLAAQETPANVSSWMKDPPDIASLADWTLPFIAA
jgi:hypothetical protein